MDKVEMAGDAGRQADPCSIDFRPFQWRAFEQALVRD